MYVDFRFTSIFVARPVVQCSAVLCEQATELSQQLLLLQADTRHHALQPAAVCRSPQISDSMAYASLLKAAAAVTDTFLNSLVILIVV